MKQPLEVFFKKFVLEIFTKFTEKHLCQSLSPANLLKKRLWHRCFPVNFVKFLRTSLFTEHLRTTASGDVKFFFGFSLMEYLRATASSIYPPEKLFRKFLKKSPENTLEPWRRSFFNDVADSTPEILQICNLN